MYLTQFFYLNENNTKIYCHNKFCIHPKKTKVYKTLSKFMSYDPQIIGIGYEYNMENTGTKVTHKKLK